MATLWGDQRKFSTWRRLWVALAEAEAELGLPITQEQIAELRAHVDDIDFDAAEQYERKLRHDVMAHVHAYGDQCPTARPIIHLGATSCYVTDNTDLILIRESLQMVAAAAGGGDRRAGRLRQAVSRPADAQLHALAAGPADDRRPAGLPVGVRPGARSGGSRAPHRVAQGPQRERHDRHAGQLPGAVRRRSRQGPAARSSSSPRRWASTRPTPITGQTYSRKVDAQVLDALAGIAASSHKAATDLRILAHRKEIEEPFEKDQIGSSAMAYKRNPMRSERICALARFAMSLAANAAETHATQWMERTLDDSANRRLVMPQAFLAIDAILILYQNVATGLVVYPQVIAKHLREELPFMATENILMAAVAAGGDRQELHERIRQHSQAAAAVVKAARRRERSHRPAEGRQGVRRRRYRCRDRPGQAHRPQQGAGR